MQEDCQWSAPPLMAMNVFPSQTGYTMNNDWAGEIDFVPEFSSQCILAIAGLWEE